MEGENGVTRSITDNLHSLDIQGDQIEGESCVTRTIIDETHSSDIQADQMEGGSGVSQRVSLMNFILGISKETNWKVKGCCYSNYRL